MKTPKKVLPTYKTASGAQQYVRGNTPEEKRKNISSLQKVTKDPKAYAALSAMYWAQESKNISDIVGPKKAKTDSMVSAANKMEAESMKKANAYKAKGQSAKSGASRSVAGKVKPNPNKSKATYLKGKK